MHVKDKERPIRELLQYAPGEYTPFSTNQSIDCDVREGEKIYQTLHSRYHYKFCNIHIKPIFKSSPQLSAMLKSRSTPPF